MVIIKKSINNKCLGRCGERGTLVHYWWKYKLVQPLWKTIWRFHKKLKIELPYDPAILLLCIYAEKTKTLIQKDICIPIFTAELFAIDKWKQSKCQSTDEWIKKMYTYTMGCYLAIRSMKFCHVQQHGWT